MSQPMMWPAEAQHYYPMYTMASPNLEAFHSFEREAPTDNNLPREFYPFASDEDPTRHEDNFIYLQDQQPEYPGEDPIEKQFEMLTIHD